MEHAPEQQPSRRAHHLWEAELDENGRRKLRRSRMEKEMFDTQARQASRKIAAETVAAYWGLFGADLVDDPTLSEDIPVSVSRRFNSASRQETPPHIHTWDELRSAFGMKMVQDARQAVADGMKTRMASKYFDVPFLVAAEILAELPNEDKQAIKLAIDALYDGLEVTASRRGPTLAHRIAAIFAEFEDDDSRRIAVDSRAKSYWEDYYGPFGVELVKEVKRRVRADLAAAWMRKNGVDDVAAEYWSQYFGAYGEDWVKIVPKKISPAN